MKYTIVEIAEKLDIEEKAAEGLVHFLIGVKPPLAKFRGERPTTSGRGRGAFVYEVVQGAGALARPFIDKLTR